MENRQEISGLLFLSGFHLPPCTRSAHDKGAKELQCRNNLHPWPSRSSVSRPPCLGFVPLVDPTHDGAFFRLSVPFHPFSLAPFTPLALFIFPALLFFTIFPFFFPFLSFPFFLHSISFLPPAFLLRHPRFHLPRCRYMRLGTLNLMAYSAGATTAGAGAAAEAIGAKIC
jgi:hypothetical protein